MTGKQIVSMKALTKRFSADVQNATARLNKPVGNTIGIRNSKFTYKQELIGRSMIAIAIDFVHAQTWYEDAYDPDNPSPPSCHALSVDGEEMQPLKASPLIQADFCDGCPLDAWGTADIGRGKACAQQYKIAVVAAGPGETLANCEMAILTLPPTSMKNWEKYVKDLGKGEERPPYGVYTRFSFVEEEEWPILEFELDQLITDVSEANAILGRLDEARELLMTPPDFSGFDDAPARKKKSKKKAKKKVVKKKSKKKAKKKSKKKAKKKSKKKTGASKFS